MLTRTMILSLGLALLGGGLLAPELDAQRRPDGSRAPRLERRSRAQRGLQLSEEQRHRMKDIAHRHRQAIQEARQALREARRARRDELGGQLTPRQRQRLQKPGAPSPGREAGRRGPSRGQPGRGLTGRRRPV
jgi:hypothetical protein